MKRNILLPAFFLVMFSWQSSIYNIDVITINGNKISMNSFADKKIIIAPFNAANPDINWLRKLDSLQRSDTLLRVIAVPANDLGGTGSDTKLASLMNTLSLQILMLKSTFAKKTTGTNQHPLFKWLTNVNENTHFDVDVESARQLFIVNRNGNLYSVINDPVSPNILTQVLNQNVDKSFDM